VPLRIGGGSRIKILEALAAGKAVISTTIGAEGLDVVSGEHLLVADSPAAFAGGIEELLASTTLRRRLSNNGRKLVTDRYGWDQIANRLESIWYDVSEHQAAVRKVSFSPLEFEGIR
jgi:glycosyltransferase involved in cell wall biosynthesis